MKHMNVIVLAALVAMPHYAVGQSLLRPQTFPGTFNDLPFIERVQIQAAGYEPWEPDYDDQGRCISGCPYVGMTIEDDLARLEHQTKLAVSQLQSAGLLSGGVAPSTIKPNAPVIEPRPAPQITASKCTPNQPGINSVNRVPLGEPLIGTAKISSPFGDRIHPIRKRRIPHYGVDLSVPVGTDVFSPAAGTVISVWTNDSCGRGIHIMHSDGYETVYCHLNKQMVQVGDTVDAGCRIGQSGNTGASTGPHLHYAIKLNGTYINPVKLMGRG